MRKCGTNSVDCYYHNVLKKKQVKCIVAQEKHSRNKYVRSTRHLDLLFGYLVIPLGVLLLNLVLLKFYSAITLVSNFKSYEQLHFKLLSMNIFSGLCITSL